MFSIRQITAFSLLVFFIVGCASSPPRSSGLLQVVATTTIVGDVVQAIGGDHVQLTVLLPAETDPHAFEPAPRDAALVSEAGLIFINGFGLDVFIEPLLDSGSSVVIVSDGIQALESQGVAHEAEEGDEHADELTLDPHAWQDPTNVIIWSENITSALTTADPANAADYEANAAAYIEALNDLDEWIMEQVAVLAPRARVLVTDHEALGYFARRYEFEIVGVVIPSVSTVASPSAQELVDLEREIEEHKAPAIFIGTSANPDLVNQLAEDLGVAVVPIYGEALSAAEGLAGTYLEMMRYNVSAIVDALH